MRLLLEIYLIHRINLCGDNSCNSLLMFYETKNSIRELYKLSLPSSTNNLGALLGVIILNQGLHMVKIF